MSQPDDTIQALEAALQVSPDNLPLRQHLAEVLCSRGRYADAIEHYRFLVRSSPDNVALQLTLADVYFQNRQISEAAVIVEQLIKRRDATAEVHLLATRLAIDEGNTQSAVFHYKTALELDPEVEDEGLSDQLGFGTDVEDDDEVFEGRVRQGTGGGADEFDLDVERPKISFTDVGGMKELKNEIELKIIHPLNHPDIYAAYGKSIGGGIMMYGPPGCGKTHLARATAGQINAGFICVGINDVLDMWMGNSERNLHSLFAHARQNAPCVLFFDEVDALGGRRTDMQGGSARRIINQFLAEMDGAESSNEGILILSATNAPWHVDAAFRRPGRFDRVLFVPPPDEPARAEILKIMCQEKPVKDLNFQQLAKKTSHFSGADLKAVVDMAIESKLEEALKTGRPIPVTGKDLLAAAKRHKPTTKEWFATARNYALYSNEGGLYDDILSYLNIK